MKQLCNIFLILTQHYTSFKNHLNQIYLEIMFFFSCVLLSTSHIVEEVWPQHTSLL